MKKNITYDQQNGIPKNSYNKKFLKFITEKKKNVLFTVFLFLILCLFGIPFFIHYSTESKKNASENVEEYIEKLGKEFYEDYYYLQLEDLIENQMIEDTPTFLENFVTTGIPVTLNQILELHFKTEKELRKSLEKYQCDYETTGFIIYPEHPYEKKSYRIEPQIACKNLNLEVRDN